MSFREELMEAIAKSVYTGSSLFLSNNYYLQIYYFSEAACYKIRISAVFRDYIEEYTVEESDYNTRHVEAFYDKIKDNPVLKNKLIIDDMNNL